MAPARPTRSPSPSAARAAPLLWAMTALARAASAAKEILLAMALGTTPWKDALVVAWTAPTLIAATSNESLPALLTPAWAGGRPAPAVRRIVWLTLATLAALSAAACLWPRLLVRALAPALRPPALGAAITLERLLAVNIALLGAQTILAARLNADRRFGWAPLGAGLPALGAIAALMLSLRAAPARRVLAAAWGLSAGSLASLVVLGLAWRCAPRPGGRERPGQAGACRAAAPATPLWRPLAALLLAVLILNLVPVAERMAASALRSGSLAAYDYGERLVRYVFGLSVAPFTALSFTRLSELASESPSRAGRAARTALAAHVDTGLRGLMVLVAPLAAVLAVFAPLITRCVYGWGRFGGRSLAATSPVVALLGGGLALDAAVYFLLFASYARREAAAKLPLALVLAAVNVPLAFLGAHAFGLAGLAAAHLAGGAAALGWYASRERRRRSGLRGRSALAPAVQAFALTLAPALAARALLPAAAFAGRLAAAPSWAWLAAALALTAIGAAALARCLAPALVHDLRAALAAAQAPPIPAALELVEAG